MKNPITTIRSEIEAEIASFAANAARGASHLSFNHLPSILLRMLDMVEHYAGKELDLAKTDVASVETKVVEEVKARAAADTDLGEKVEAIAAKVEDNAASLEEVKEVVPALSDDADKKPAKKKKDS